jgi:hypothetical protein
MTKLLKVILIILFIGCLFDMPYGYFQMVRFLAMCIFIFLNLKENNQNWKWFWIGSAILINPFFKIYFGRLIWNIMDVIWAVTLVFSLFANLKENSKNGF